MAQNKKSVWSLIILVCTVISLVTLVASIIVTVIGLPVALEVAKQAAIAEGGAEAEVSLAVAIALGVAVAVLIIASLFSILEIIGGFMFSLKGRWGIFCIVIGIITTASSVYSVFNGFVSNAGVVSIVTSFVSLAVSFLFVVACFKHYAEIR